MKKIIKIITRWMIRVLPGNICQKAIIIFSKIIDLDEIEEIALSHFTDKLINNYNAIVKKIVTHRKVMIINEMVWGGTYFNVAVLNNILGLVIYCLYLGYIPIIQINEDDENAFSWDWYFKQPLEDYTSTVKIKSYKALNKRSVGFSCQWIFEQSGVDYARWHFIYKNLVLINDKTKEYIENENTKLGGVDTVLGVLMRGTDYISLKPKGHPIQPEIDEVIEKAQDIMINNNYRAIYMATEDETYFNAFEKKFGVDKVLSNERVYYNKKYIPGDLIGRVHFDRENDNYKKGLEYLSSIVLLSKCKSLLAGNCGGTKFALLYSEFPYTICSVFNKGLY